MSILKNYFEHPEDRNDFFIALVVILFFGVAIIGYLYNANPKEVEMSNNELPDRGIIATSDKTENESILAPIPLHRSIKRQQKEWLSQLEEKGISNTTALASISEDSISIDLDTMNSVFATDIVEPVVASDSIDQRSNDTSKIETILRGSNEMKTLGEKDTMRIVETTELIDSLESPLETTFTNTGVNEYSTVAKDGEDRLGQEDCAIFLGAFKSKANAERLVTKLNKNPDYVVFSNYERGYQVVGVKVSCEKQAANQVLKDIRERYSKDAWFAPVKSEE